MKLLIIKLDNGYTLTVTHTPVEAAHGLIERKERFAFETYPPLAQAIDRYMVPDQEIPMMNMADVAERHAIRYDEFQLEDRVMAAQGNPQP